MKVNQIGDFINGWFIGPFEPSLFKTEHFECAVKKYMAGSKEQLHYHKIAKEFTIIISGVVKMNNITFEGNTIIEIDPGESTDFEAITDVTTLVIKVPAVRNDKFLIKKA